MKIFSAYARNAAAAALLVVSAMGLVAVPAFADQTWAAIAISGQTGAWGRGFDWPTQAGAEARALSECGKFATDCVVAGWAHGQYCVAVAVKRYQDGTVAWGSNSAPTLVAARAAAMEACAKYAKGPCDDVVADVCAQN